MTKTIPTPTMADFASADGAHLLGIVKRGRTSKSYFPACDEVDRRASKRARDGRPYTEPIAEALVILDRRGVPHGGKKDDSGNYPVLGDSEKRLAKAAATAAVVEAKAATEVVTETAPSKSKGRPVGSGAGGAVHTARRKEAGPYRTEQFHQGVKMTYREACLRVGTLPANVEAAMPFEPFEPTDREWLPAIITVIGWAIFTAGWLAFP